MSGFVTGLLFSGYLQLAHRGRSIMEVGVGRSALAGALIAAALPVTTTLAWSIGAGIALSPLMIFMSGLPAMVLGAVTAGGSVAIARRGEVHEIESATREALGP